MIVFCQTTTSMDPNLLVICPNAVHFIFWILFKNINFGLESMYASYLKMGSAFEYIVPITEMVSWEILMRLVKRFHSGLWYIVMGNITLYSKRMFFDPSKCALVKLGLSSSSLWVSDFNTTRWEMSSFHTSSILYSFCSL